MVAGEGEQEGRAGVARALFGQRSLVFFLEGARTRGKGIEEEYKQGDKGASFLRPNEG